MNTAIVRSRSRYSSMSRLMNVGPPSAVEGPAAVRYRGKSRSTTLSTTSSNAHIEMWLAMADTLTDT